MWLALFAQLALAHDPTDCPAPSALAGAVRRGPLNERARACLPPDDLGTAKGRALAWIGWRDQLWREGPTPALDARTAALLAATHEPERTLDAAETLMTPAPALAVTAVTRSAELLAAQPWSVGWEALAARWTALATTAHAPIAPPRPAPPAPDALRTCLDVGRLWDRAAFGGVYASDRDCAVRLTETLEGAAQQRAAELALALALALAHDDAVARQLVIARLAVLTPDNPTVQAIWRAQQRAEEAPSAGSR